MFPTAVGRFPSRVDHAVYAAAGGRRNRTRHPPPTPPYPGHPSHQPWHEPRSGRRTSRPQLTIDDNDLRADRRPNRRRRILRCYNANRSALREDRGIPTRRHGRPEHAAACARESTRLLGNGHCTRPAVLDCRYETICETCTHFATTIEFRPTLQPQRDDADEKGQTPGQRYSTESLNASVNEASWTSPLDRITRISSTTAASTNTAATSHPSIWRQPITLNTRDQPPAELSNQKVSGLTGTVHGQLDISDENFEPPVQWCRGKVLASLRRASRSTVRRCGRRGHWHWHSRVPARSPS